jgi:hypothetical protein
VSTIFQKHDFAFPLALHSSLFAPVIHSANKHTTYSEMIRRSSLLSRRFMSSKPQQKDAAKALQNAFLRSVKKTDEKAPISPPAPSINTPLSSSSSPPTPDLDFSKLKDVEASDIASTPSMASAAKPNFSSDIFEFAPRIKVIGVGGGGCNAVSNMVDRGLAGVDFLACNTDAQHLLGCKTENRIQLGKHLTQGLGCGANPNDG